MQCMQQFLRLKKTYWQMCLTDLSSKAYLPIICWLCVCTCLSPRKYRSIPFTASCIKGIDSFKLTEFSDDKAGEVTGSIHAITQAITQGVIVQMGVHLAYSLQLRYHAQKAKANPRRQLALFELKQDLLSLAHCNAKHVSRDEVPAKHLVLELTQAIEAKRWNRPPSKCLMGHSRRQLGLIGRIVAELQTRWQKSCNWVIQLGHTVWSYSWVIQLGHTAGSYSATSHPKR